MTCDDLRIIRGCMAGGRIQIIMTASYSHMYQKVIPTPLWSGTWNPVDVDIVIPVYNEELELESSVNTLISWLDSKNNTKNKYTWRVTIADNASTDQIWNISEKLAKTHPQKVRAMHIDEKGRGLALRVAWKNSKARICAYMDVDLSTDLHALDPLLEPLLLNQSDISVGSRLMSGSHTTRRKQREFISCCYNKILKFYLKSEILDAQCGFKALTFRAAKNFSRILKMTNGSLTRRCFRLHKHMAYASLKYRYHGLKILVRQ